VTLTFSKPLKVIAPRGNRREVHRLVFHRGTRHLVILTGRYGPWYLYLKLIAKEKRGPVFYRMGPIKGPSAPWPDFSALNRHHLNPETFADQVWARFLAQIAPLSSVGSSSVLAYVDFFDLLARGLPEGPLYREFRRRGIALLGMLLRGQKQKGMDLLLMGTPSPVRPRVRINFGGQVFPEDVLVRSHMGTARFYGPIPVNKVRTRITTLLDSLGVPRYGRRWDEEPGSLAVALPPGCEAGYCPRGARRCEPTEGAIWGHGGPVQGWIVSTKPISGRFEDYSSLSRELWQPRGKEKISVPLSPVGEKRGKTCMTSTHNSWYER
ncbi:hypothetical protein KKF84_04565, partial [Myxococcota bacterium]|nr:hypothetical protein [Myxococcota bacterium]